MSKSWAVVTMVCIAGCAGPTADSPITVSLGSPRDAVMRDLKAKHRYCAKVQQPPPPPSAPDIYERCDRPGAEWGESWIEASYEDNKLVALKRYERFADDARAVERWNQLVGDRGKLTAESAEATAALRGRALEPGTRSVKAFKIDDTTIVGVYLLTPTPPEDASILEAMIRIK